MFRGCRWQLLLLIVAVILLGVALLFQPFQPDNTNVGTPVTPPTMTPVDAAQDVAPLPLPPAVQSTVVEFHEGVVGDVQRLNPLFAAVNPVDRDIASLIFEGLVGANQYGEYVPRLAESWTISNNGTEYVFRLRQDVLWQDGIPFTTADVATTVEFLQAPDSQLPAEMTDFWQTVELELLDESTVRFRLAQPLASFLDRLRIGLIPAHVFDGLAPAQLAGHPFNLSPIGTGPYQLERLVGDETGITSVSLRVAPVYRQRPEGQGGYTLERVVFELFADSATALAALRSGAIDALGGIAGAEVVDLEQAKVVETHITMRPEVGVALFNWESEHTLAFQDHRVRQALLLGADRVGLVNRHLGGQAVVADSPFVPGSWAYQGPINWPSYDPVAAMEILSEVEFAMPVSEEAADEESDAAEAPSDDVPAEGEETATPEPTEVVPVYDFSVLASNEGPQSALAAELAEQWRQLGLTITLETVSPTELYARVEAGDFDVALVELSYEGGVDPDLYPFWHQGQYPDGQNYAGVNDRRSSELLEYARRDSNGIHRTTYYADFQRMFANRALAMLLYYPVYEYAVNADIQGVQLGYLGSPADRLASLGSWTFGPE
ncbi:ABC transporter substrate-binding protein [Chloroflexota bacterium]